GGRPRARVRPRGDDLEPRGRAGLRGSGAQGDPDRRAAGGPQVPDPLVRAADLRAAEPRPVSLARRLLVLAVVTGLLAAVASAAAALSPRRERLPSGLTVLVRENSATPVVAASLFVRVGSRWETEDDAGITHLLQQVLLKGTATRSALEVAESAEALGGGISASADMDFSEVRATALARNWKKMLELLADVALHPTLPEAEIEGERQAMLTALRSRQDQPFPRAMDTVMAKVYGEHPYGRPILGRPVALAKIDRAALVSHHLRLFRAPRVGEGDADPTPAAAVARADRSVIVKPSAQAQVVVAFLAPPTSHPDYAAVKVLATALG